MIIWGTFGSFPLCGRTAVTTAIQGENKESSSIRRRQDTLRLQGREARGHTCGHAHVTNTPAFYALHKALHRSHFHFVCLVFSLKNTSVAFSPQNDKKEKKSCLVISPLVSHQSALLLPLSLYPHILPFIPKPLPPSSPLLSAIQPPSQLYSTSDSFCFYVVHRPEHLFIPLSPRCLQSGEAEKDEEVRYKQKKSSARGVDDRFAKGRVIQHFISGPYL